MIEFGSDFHLFDNNSSAGKHLTDVVQNATLLADGRQCMVALIRQYGWKRIWMPDYFCYEVIDTIKTQTGIKVELYEDNPLLEGQVENLPFREGDVLLRMNFFGLRGPRSNKKISCPVIEDHTHDPIGRWALYSDADWCISSIRKTLPIPEGGMMWSPKGNRLEINLIASEENEKVATTRWEGMEMKAAYLNGENICKDEFRKRYTETEDWFDHAEPTLIDEKSKEVVSKQLDINVWQGAKRNNWSLLKSLVKSDVCKVLEPEEESCTAFSLVLYLDTKEIRDSVRKCLIESCVYPAILWVIPDSASDTAKDFSEKMLSVHCDGRYSEEDIKQLARLLNKALEI